MIALATSSQAAPVVSWITAGSKYLSTNEYCGSYKGSVSCPSPVLHLLIAKIARSFAISYALTDSVISLPIEATWAFWM